MLLGSNATGCAETLYATKPAMPFAFRRLILPFVRRAVKKWRLSKGGRGYAYAVWQAVFRSILDLLEAALMKWNLKIIVSVLALLSAASQTQADIFEWAPTFGGPVQSSVVCPGGSGVFAVPSSNLAGLDPIPLK